MIFYAEWNFLPHSLGVLPVIAVKVRVKTVGEEDLFRPVPQHHHHQPQLRESAVVVVR